MNPYDILSEPGHEGKFTAQFKARKPQLRGLKTLEEFAHYILAHPTEFNKISKQRANFYKNLIAPKIGGLTPKMMKDLRAYHRQVGGKISAKDFELMLQETYKSPDKRDKNIGDYNIDESLSTPENVVYHNPKTGETKVAYRGTEGTLKDWGNNALYAFGLHNTSKRYKRSNDIQKQVEQKYGTQNLDVLGHSQSGAYAQEIGKNAKNVIVLNPATHPGYTPKTKNATVVRSKGDAVSGLKYLNPLNWGKKKTADVEIEAKTYNPVTEHMPAVLERLPEDTILGNGRGGVVWKKRLIKRKKGQVIKSTLNRTPYKLNKLLKKHQEVLDEERDMHADFDETMPLHEQDMNNIISNIIYSQDYPDEEDEEEYIPDFKKLLADNKYLEEEDVTINKDLIKKLKQRETGQQRGLGRTYKQKFNKKHGFPKDKSHSLTDIAKITGYDKKHLQIILDKGQGAYFSNPESVRPNVKSPEQWAMARLYASLDPTSKASKIDKSHLVKNKKLRNLCDCGVCPYCR